MRTCVPEAGIKGRDKSSSYTPQYLWDIITCSCKRYLPLAQVLIYTNHLLSIAVTYFMWDKWIGNRLHPVISLGCSPRLSHLCNNFNGALAKQLLKLGHGWVSASLIYMHVSTYACSRFNYGFVSKRPLCLHWFPVLYCDMYNNRERDLGWVNTLRPRQNGRISQTTF